MEKIPEQYSEEKYQILIRKRLKFLESFSDDEAVHMTDKLIERGIELLEKYLDARDYASFHVLIGSTGVENMSNIRHDDFPGEDSVELYIDNLMDQK